MQVVTIRSSNKWVPPVLQVRFAVIHMESYSVCCAKFILKAWQMNLLSISYTLWNSPSFPATSKAKEL